MALCVEAREGGRVGESRARLAGACEAAQRRAALRSAVGRETRKGLDVGSESWEADTERQSVDRGLEDVEAFRPERPEPGGENPGSPWSG